MHLNIIPILLALSSLSTLGNCAYSLLDDYPLDTFFDKFDFLTCTNTSASCNPRGGFVEYVDRPTAEASGLVSHGDGSVIIKPDTTTVLLATANTGRKTVRLQSKRVYNHGVSLLHGIVGVTMNTDVVEQLFIVDVKHTPGGTCGTSPFISLISNSIWPTNSELGFVQSHNIQRKNTMSLKTPRGGCIGSRGDCHASSRCETSDPQTDSAGILFNENSGGVFAVERTPTFAKIWFFPRSSPLLANVLSDSPDPTLWGKPGDIFVSEDECDIDKNFFGARIMIDLSFCAKGSGLGFLATCKSTTKVDCNEFVAANPSNFTDTRWEIQSLKVFAQPGDVTATPTTPPSRTSCSSAGFIITASSTSDDSLGKSYLTLVPIEGYKAAHIEFTPDRKAASALCISDDGLLAAAGSDMQAWYRKDEYLKRSLVVMVSPTDPIVQQEWLTGFRCSISTLGEFECLGNDGFEYFVTDELPDSDDDEPRRLEVSRVSPPKYGPLLDLLPIAL